MPGGPGTRSRLAPPPRRPSRLPASASGPHQSAPRAWPPSGPCSSACSSGSVAVKLAGQSLPGRVDSPGVHCPTLDAITVHAQAVEAAVLASRPPGRACAWCSCGRRGCPRSSVENIEPFECNPNRLTQQSTNSSNQVTERHREAELDQIPNRQRGEMAGHAVRRCGCGRNTCWKPHLERLAETLQHLLVMCLVSRHAQHRGWQVVLVHPGTAGLPCPPALGDTLYGEHPDL